jgi:hypothetical protein
MGYDILLKDIDILTVQGTVLPAPWIARKELHGLTLSLHGAMDNVVEATGNGYVKT